MQLLRRCDRLDNRYLDIFHSFAMVVPTLASVFHSFLWPVLPRVIYDDNRYDFQVFGISAEAEKRRMVHLHVEVHDGPEQARLQLCGSWLLEHDLPLLVHDLEGSLHQDSWWTLALPLHRMHSDEHQLRLDAYWLHCYSFGELERIIWREGDSREVHW